MSRGPPSTASELVLLAQHLHGVADPHTSLPPVSVQNFRHGQHTVRGLRADTDIRAGEDVLKMSPQFLPPASEVDSMPALPDDDPEWRLVLWLAAEKARLLAAASVSASTDQYWNAYIKSLPTLNEYRSAGLPLATLPEELHQLEGLPKVNELSAWVKTLHEQLAARLKYYNVHRGALPEIDWDDALWSLTSVYSRSFSHLSTEPTMVPVGDLLNHAGLNANLRYQWDDDDRTLVFQAKRNITKGEELTDDYILSDDDPTHFPPAASLTMTKFYGMFDGAPQDRWRAGDCASIIDSGLGTDKSVFLKMVDALAKHNCHSGDATRRARASSVQMARMILLPALDDRSSANYQRSRSADFL